MSVVPTATGFRVIAVNKRGEGTLTIVGAREVVREIEHAIHFARAGSSLPVQLDVPETIQSELTKLGITGSNRD